MRLLNVKTLKIEEFMGSKIPPYAILSHTWNDREASFVSWRGRWSAWCYPTDPRFFKILKACKQAKREQLEYLWVDTICIDKRSSQDLSEAINSMYAWYRDAEVCYAYLADVRSPSKPREGLIFPLKDLEDEHGPFQRSKWWTRGWTLQELLAPSEVNFYSKDWIHMGTRSVMSKTISRVTGIDELCIKRLTEFETYSVAERMSWAADRLTTREEDVAYSLLGIFNIHMASLYGEGQNAFLRLQQEIIRTRNDHSFMIHEKTTEELCQDAIYARHPPELQDQRC